VNNLNKAFNLAFVAYVVAGSGYFLFYMLQYKKPFYLLLAFLIYFASYILRNKILKIKNKLEYSEVGLFFISLLFLAYTLYILKLDSDVVKYLPNKILMYSGSVFVTCVIVYFVSLSRFRSSKISNIILIILVVVIVKLYDNKIDYFFVSNPWISDLIIGTPYLYLFSVLLGLILNKPNVVK